MNEKSLPPLPTPKFTETIRGVPCITVTEHENLMRTYALQAIALRPVQVPMTDREIEPVGVPDALKDHQIAAIVNTLRDIARQFHGHDSLRERIANVLVPALKAETQHPAPGVLDDVARDAERYRWLRDNQLLAKTQYMPTSPRGYLDAAIDAAMLAASPAQKGD